MQYARLASDYFPETWKMSRLLRCSPYARNIVAKKKWPRNSGPSLGETREKSGKISNFLTRKADARTCQRMP
jgi:hypothetical protein